MRIAAVLGLFAFFALQPDSLRAAEQGQSALPPGMALKKMVTLTTDRNSDVYYLHLMLEGKAGPAGMFVEPDGRNQPDPDSNPNGKPFFLADIEKPEGVALFETQGRKVLIMQGSINRTTLEGRFHLKYLSDGLGMTYESCDFNLRNSNGEFWVQNIYTNQKVTDLVIETSFFGVVTLRGICPVQ